MFGAACAGSSDPLPHHCLFVCISVGPFPERPLPEARANAHLVARSFRKPRFHSEVGFCIAQACHKARHAVGALSVVLGFGCSSGYIFALCVRVSTPKCVRVTLSLDTRSRQFRPLARLRIQLCCPSTSRRMRAHFESHEAFNRRLNFGFYRGTRAQARSQGARSSPKAMASS